MESVNHAESGSATVLVALAMVTIASLAVLMFQLFYSAGQQVHARDVADSAAISAAIIYRDQGSQGEACSRAAQIAEGYSVDCVVEGERVRVSVRKEARFGWITRSYKATAVAGPSERDGVQNLQLPTR